jgi:DNA polymerase-3 subunit delta'
VSDTDFSYPWFANLQAQLDGQYVADKLPHAILLTGETYSGKLIFAIQLAKRFLCDETKALAAVTPTPCNDCASCHLFEAGTHPDFSHVAPQDSKQIKIDQVRGLIAWVATTSQRNGLKVAIVDPAEQMNHQSANALLKCLEEPSGNTFIILVSSRSGSLLPTIRSRCQQYAIGLPERSQALQWLHAALPNRDDYELLLDIAGGLPLAVTMQLNDDYLASRKVVVEQLAKLCGNQTTALKSVAEVQKIEIEDFLDICQSIFSDAVRYDATKDINAIRNSDIADSIVQIQNHTSVDFLIAAYNRSCADLRIVRSTSNPNKQQLLEALWIDLRSGNPHVISQFGL